MASHLTLTSEQVRFLKENWATMELEELSAKLHAMNLPGSKNKPPNKGHFDRLRQKYDLPKRRHLTISPRYDHYNKTPEEREALAKAARERANEVRRQKRGTPERLARREARKALRLATQKERIERALENKRIRSAQQYASKRDPAIDERKQARAERARLREEEKQAKLLVRQKQKEERAAAKEAAKPAPKPKPTKLAPKPKPAKPAKPAPSAPKRAVVLQSRNVQPPKPLPPPITIVADLGEDLDPAHAKLLEKQSRARAFLQEGKDPLNVIVWTGLPGHMVYAIVGQLRREKKGQE